jgi:hypothetical protein
VSDAKEGETRAPTRQTGGSVTPKNKNTVHSKNLLTLRREQTCCEAKRKGKNFGVFAVMQQGRTGVLLIVSILLVYTCFSFKFSGREWFSSEAFAACQKCAECAGCQKCGTTSGQPAAGVVQGMVPSKPSDKPNDDINLLGKLLKWRRQAGELTCKISASEIGLNGGWCLEPKDTTTWHDVRCRSAKNHQPPDEGIARCKTLRYKLLPQHTLHANFLFTCLRRALFRSRRLATTCRQLYVRKMRNVSQGNDAK